MWGLCEQVSCIRIGSMWKSVNCYPINLNHFVKLESQRKDSCFQPHYEVTKRKYFPRYWPFARGIHQSPVSSPHKGQWRGTLMFSLICVWTNGGVHNRNAGDLRRHRAHYGVTLMSFPCIASFATRNKFVRQWWGYTTTYGLPFVSATSDLCLTFVILVLNATSYIIRLHYKCECVVLIYSRYHSTTHTHTHTHIWCIFHIIAAGATCHMSSKSWYWLLKYWTMATESPQNDNVEIF